MKASISNQQQQFAAAPAATIATAVQAERPKTGERMIRLGSLLPEAARADESMYAFLYFTREDDGRQGTVYYAPPDAQVHADARLCLARKTDGQQQQGVLALAKVCGGSGEDGDRESMYPETILLGEDGDEFESDGLCIDRIIGTDNDEYEDATCDERAAAAERHAKDVGGRVYTQVDVDGGTGIAYELGLHLVNRTGVYAVVRRAPAKKTDNGDGGELAGVISVADIMVHRARADEAVKLVDKAAKLIAEAEYDAKRRISDEIPGMLNDARNDLTQAAAAYMSLVERAEAAAAAVHRAWHGAVAANEGRCALRASLQANVADAEYVNDWYDFSGSERDDLCFSGENVKYYTDEYRERLEKNSERLREHDAACRHPACVGASSSAPGGGDGDDDRKCQVGNGQDGV